MWGRGELAGLASAPLPGQGKYKTKRRKDGERWKGNTSSLFSCVLPCGVRSISEMLLVSVSLLTTSWRGS